MAAYLSTSAFAAQFKIISMTKTKSLWHQFDLFYVTLLTYANPHFSALRSVGLQSAVNSSTVRTYVVTESHKASTNINQQWTWVDFLIRNETFTNMTTH